MRQEKVYEPGQTLTLRLGKDLQPDDLKYLNELRNEEGNFNKTAVNLFLEAIEKRAKGNDQQVVIPLPDSLTPEQKERLASADVRNLLGQLVHLLLANPAASIVPIVGQMVPQGEQVLVEKPVKKTSKSKRISKQFVD